MSRRYAITNNKHAIISNLQYLCDDSQEPLCKACKDTMNEIIQNAIDYINILSDKIKCMEEQIKYAEDDIKSTPYEPYEILTILKKIRSV